MSVVSMLKSRDLYEFIQGKYPQDEFTRFSDGTVTSGEGAPVRVKDLLRKLMPVEDTSHDIKHESGRIGCDACPVPEG